MKYLGVCASGDRYICGLRPNKYGQNVPSEDRHRPLNLYSCAG